VQRNHIIIEIIREIILHKKTYKYNSNLKSDEFSYDLKKLIFSKINFVIICAPPHTTFNTTRTFIFTIKNENIF